MNRPSFVHDRLGGLSDATGVDDEPRSACDLQAVQRGGRVEAQPFLREQALQVRQERVRPDCPLRRAFATYMRVLEVILNVLNIIADSLVIVAPQRSREHYRGLSRGLSRELFS